MVKRVKRAEESGRERRVGKSGGHMTMSMMPMVGMPKQLGAAATGCRVALQPPALSQAGGGGGGGSEANPAAAGGGGVDVLQPEPEEVAVLSLPCLDYSPPLV